MKVEVSDMAVIGDERGSLIAIESGHNVPFDIKRCYYIFNTTPGVRRGYHAHRMLNQLLICTSGSCKIYLDDGFDTTEVLLDSPTKSLHIQGLIWREMYDFSDDCVLMVLADNYYDESDYIRDYHCFLEEVRRGK